MTTTAAPGPQQPHAVAAWTCPYCPRMYKRRADLTDREWVYLSETVEKNHRWHCRSWPRTPAAPSAQPDEVCTPSDEVYDGEQFCAVHGGPWPCTPSQPVRDTGGCLACGDTGVLLNGGNCDSARHDWSDDEEPVRDTEEGRG